MLKAHWVDLYPIFSYFPVAAVEYVEQWRHALVAGLTLGEGSRQNRGEAAADRPAGSRGINPIKPPGKLATEYSRGGGRMDKFPKSNLAPPLIGENGTLT